MKTTLPFVLDLNFYPEREDEAHWTLMQMFDGRGGYPADIPLTEMIRLVVDGELLLWDAMYEVDDEGEIHARWRRRPVEK
jgi:hypothetical protein